MTRKTHKEAQRRCTGDTEVYSRVTGFYRPVRNWNAGKVAEFGRRKVFNPTLAADGGRGDGADGSGRKRG